MARSKELSQFAPLVTVLSGTTTLDSNYSISGNLTVSSNTISLGTEGATISYNSGTNLIELNTGLVVDSISIGGAGASGSFDTGSISYAANTITGYNTNEDISITANGTGRIVINNAVVINNDLTLTGTTLRAPATFTIDPAAHGDDTGTVVIKGNLQVDGTTTTINSTTLTVDDKNIVIASGAADAAAANGAGITVDGANATFTYTSTNDQFELNKGLKLPLGVKVTEFSDDGTLSGASDLAVPTEKAVKTYVNDFQAATFEPTGFSRGAPNTMGVIEFSLDGTTVYSIDQNSNQTTRTDGKFATGTPWEAAAAPRTLAMYPANGQSSFIIWQSGIKYTFTTLQTASFTAGQQAAHYFFFDQGVLNSYTSITGEYIQKLPFVSEVYCDESTNTVVVFGEERHGITMDGATHLYLHGTTGTRYRSGLGISGITAGATTYSMTVGGVIYDEDIAISIDNQTTNNMLYQVGNTWKITPADNKYAYMVNGVAQYNKRTGSTYSLEPIPAGSYAVMYYMATNCRIHQTMKIMGQNLFTSLALARESAQSEPRDTSLLGLPSPEFLYVGAVVVDSTGAVQTLDNNAVFVDLRLVNISAGTNSSSAAVVMTAKDSIFDNTGSGLSATNVQLALTELGQEKVDRAGDTITGSLKIVNSGRLGVGATSPGRNIEIWDSSTSTTTVGVGLLITNWDANTAGSRAGIVLKNFDNFGASIWSPRTLSTAGHLCFSTNGSGATEESGLTEKMRITNDGKVGIGTTTPSQILDIVKDAGDGSTTISVTNNGIGTSYTNGSARLRLAKYDGTQTRSHDVYFKISGAGYSDSRTTFTSSVAGNGDTDTLTLRNGNAGIGTISPSARLDVRGGDGTGGISGPTSGTWAAKIIMNQDTSGYGGLAVHSRWANANTSIFEVANGWNGATGYFPLFTVDGLGQTIWRTSTGSERMRITDDGKVGIGTSSPAVKLDTVGRIRAQQNDIGTSGALTLRQRTGDTYGAVIQWVNDANTVQKGWLQVDTSSNMILATGDNERVRIESNGNVLIGTTSNAVGARLKVGSDNVNFIVTESRGDGGPGEANHARIGGVYTNNTAVSAAMNFKFTGDGRQAHITFQTKNTNDDTQPIERLRITNGGLIGIGTSTPSVKLEVHDLVLIKGNNAAGIEYNDWPYSSLSIRRSDDYTINGITMASFGYRNDPIYLTDNSVANIRIWDSTQAAGAATSASTTMMTFGSPGPISFITGNGAERARIDSNGYVGIGKSSGMSKQLEIYGDTFPAIRIQNNSTGKTSADGLLLEMAGLDVNLWNYDAGSVVVGTSNSERMRVDSTGKVGIGTTNPNANLNVAGSVNLHNTIRTWMLGQPSVSGITSAGANCYVLKLDRSTIYYKGFTFDVHMQGGKDWSGHGFTTYFAKMCVSISSTDALRVHTIQEFSRSYIDNSGSEILFNTYSISTDANYLYLTMNYKGQLAGDGFKPNIFVVTTDCALNGSGSYQINNVYAV